MPPTPNAHPDGNDAASQAAQVLRQFRMVFNAVRTHFQQVEKQVGIGGAQVWALHTVQQRPGLSVNDLARAMDIHPSTASNLVRQLVQRQLLHTEKSAEDRRSVRLFVQAAAQTLLAAVPGPYEGVLPEALARLTPSTLTQLQTHLGALLHELGADDRAARLPLAHL